MVVPTQAAGAHKSTRQGAVECTPPAARHCSNGRPGAYQRNAFTATPTCASARARAPLGVCNAWRPCMAARRHGSVWHAHRYVSEAPKNTSQRTLVVGSVYS